jgi:hypothetical protein
VSIDQVIAKAVNAGGKGALNLMVGYRTRTCSAASRTWPPASRPARSRIRGRRSRTGRAPAVRDDGRRQAGDAAQERHRRVQAAVRRAHQQLGAVVAGQAEAGSLRVVDPTIETTATTVGLPKCSLPDARTTEIMGINASTITRDSEYQKIGGMMMDVMALALACDYNRVVTLQWGSGAGGPIFSWLQPS